MYKELFKLYLANKITKAELKLIFHGFGERFMLYIESSHLNGELPHWLEKLIETLNN